MPCVVVSGHPVPAVRFEMSDRIISYLTAQIRRWELVSSDEGEDKLVIRAGPDAVTVIGRGLVMAHTALDQARLHTIRETPARQASYAEEPWVRSVAIETIKPLPAKVESR